ncbi:unnamed protein product [Amaranthus hypochondriacus]
MGEPAKARGRGRPRKTETQRLVAPVLVQDSTEKISLIDKADAQCRSPNSKTPIQPAQVADALTKGKEKNTPSWAEIVNGQPQHVEEDTKEDESCSLQTPLPVTSSSTSVWQPAQYLAGSCYKMPSMNGYESDPAWTPAGLNTHHKPAANTWQNQE